MRKHVACYHERVWAGEGNNGAGRPLAQRLLADGEHVVDLRGEAVRAGLLMDTGHNRKTDPHDAAERRETARGGDAFHSVPLPRRRTPTTCVGSR